jgi:phthalate 4,5-cis-dihydrodiol dehydrogenase
VNDPLRLGIVGLGTAGRSLLAPIEARDDVRLVAVADSHDQARAEVASRFGARPYATLAELVADPEVDAVYVATPTDLHADHVFAVAAGGKHVLVEKPMAIDLPQAESMIEAASRAGVILMVGQSHSYDMPYAAMRELVAGGTLGRVRMMHSISYTDWVYRPRRPEELDTALGGGVTFRQGAHQFDVLRLIGGGMVRDVRAKTFDWDATRPVIGAHTAMLTFVDGTVATAVYNGYGAFLSAEISYEIGPFGNPLPAASAGKSRRAYNQRGKGDELAAKRSRTAAKDETRPPNQPFFGWLIVSCEGGDIRQSPAGLYVYTERGREEIPLPLVGTRDIMLAEFVDSIAGRRVPLHDGRWGLANLEVCVAAIESAQTDRDIVLSRQVPVPELIKSP